MMCAKVIPSEEYFYLFKGLTKAHHLNTWLSLKRRYPEVKKALSAYAKTIGCYQKQGKYYDK